MDTLLILLVVLAVLAVVGAWWLIRRPEAEAPPTPSAPSEPAPESSLRRLGLSGRMSRSSQTLGASLRGVFGSSQHGQDLWDGLEEALISADVGVVASAEIVGRVRESRPEDNVAARRALHHALKAEMAGRDRRLVLGESKPAVVMVVGVNGAGKTTSIAKLARVMQAEDRKPLLGAADTFRAAADAQLRTWGERLGVDVVGGQEGADPAAVAFDAYQAARSRGCDVVFVDTAGRLQSKHNLMAELAKVKRVLEREAGRVEEVLLVLDATAGQNGIGQVEEFAAAVGVTGIVLTKLDGTARGGVVVAVERQLGVPVKYVGVGEALEDLIPFDPAEFVDALLADA